MIKLWYIWAQEYILYEKKTSKKISNVRTAKSMDTPLKNVITRRCMGNNARTVTIRVKKKMSSERNREMMKKGKRKIPMSLQIYNTTRYSLAMTHPHAKIKKLTSKLIKCSLTNQDLRHIL